MGSNRLVDQGEVMIRNSDQKKKQERQIECQLEALRDNRTTKSAKSCTRTRTSVYKRHMIARQEASKDRWPH